MRFVQLTAAMALGAAATVATAALGQSATTYGGMSLDRYDPAARGSDWFELDSLDLRGSGRFAAGFTLDFADQPLVEYKPSGGSNTALVSDQLFAHVGASVVLWSRVRFDLNLPIALQQGGTSVTALGGENYAAPSGAALGDLRLGGDVRLFGQRGEAATGAIGLSAYLPTGSPGAWTGDGSVAIGPHFLLAGEGDWWAYAWRLAFVYRSNQNPVDGIPTGSVLQGGVSVGLKAADGKLLIGPEFYGATGVGSGQSLFDYDTTPAEIVLGIHYRIGQFVLGLAGGPGLTQAFGTPTFRGLFSFDWAPLPVLDRDHDGFADNVDACPDTPGVASDDPKLNGCPPPPPDRDNDGIPDAVDACPDTPGVASDDPKKNGCPPPPPDRDNDGIPDSVDACPDTPGVPSDDPKKNGCPPPPPDRDHDGIPDNVDACPDTPGVPSDDPKKNGCPKDTDGDGVPDSEDNCPTVPGPASNHGCPVTKKQLVVLRVDKIEILQKVFFKTAKATIQKRSFELLNQVAEVLKSHPDIAHIQVEGHTDTVGRPAKNQALSQARAESVKAYLVKQGVDEDRLVAKGFGQDKPIETNSTAVGRAANRRVEFNILPAAATEPQVAPLVP